MADRVRWVAQCPPSNSAYFFLLMLLFTQCLGREFSMNQAGYFIVRLMQRFQAFRFAPEFMPAGSLPPAHWAGMPGRQGVEKIHPAINFTMHSKVRRFSPPSFIGGSLTDFDLNVGWHVDVCRARVSSDLSRTPLYRDGGVLV